MEKVIFKVYDPVYGKYEIYEDDSRQKRVRFKDKKFKTMNGQCIEEAEGQGMYFLIDNPYINSTDIFGKLLCHNNAEDMVNSIRDGYGDVIISGLFGGQHVARFVLRSIGEELRRKSIDSFKDVIFKYALLYKNSFSLSLYGNIINEAYKTVYFNNEKEAKLYLVNNKLESKYKVIKTVYIENSEDNIILDVF